MRTESDVLIFHDETDKAGEQKMRGHVLLFVPVELRLFHWLCQVNCVSS